MLLFRMLHEVVFLGGGGFSSEKLFSGDMPPDFLHGILYLAYSEYLNISGACPWLLQVRKQNSEAIFFSLNIFMQKQGQSIFGT